MQIDELHRQLSWQNAFIEQALLVHKRGKLKQAHDSYHYVLRINPKHAQALHYLGLMAQQNNQSLQAIPLLEKSINLLPTDVRAYNHLAQVYLSQGKLAKATALLRKGLSYQPEHIDSLNSLANVLVDQGDIAQAITLYRQVIQLDGHAVHSTFNLAHALKGVGQYTEALHWYNETIAIAPHHEHAYHGAGITSEELGNFDEAISYYKKSLQHNASHVRSMANLLAIKSFSPDKNLVSLASSMVNSDQLSDEDSAKLHHGLGKYFDSKCLYDIAFGHFENSCKAQKKCSPAYDIQYGKVFCQQMIKAFDPVFFNKISTMERSQANPIFIVGMPRSGTTLVEQIIASHDDVFAAGELTVIPKLSKKYLTTEIKDLSALTASQLTTDNLASDQLIQAAQTYLDFMKKSGQQDEPLCTDKLPMNFMYLGFINAIFPKAKIIYCRRQPLDIGVSCYIEMFNLSHDFSLDLNSFAHYFLDQENIMQHWQKTLPIDIFTLKYEDLIANQAEVTGDLLAYLELDWQEECLNYHQTQRVINTPSRWQVRQPIYKTSAERWKNYQQHLTPLITALNKANYQY